MSSPLNKFLLRYRDTSLTKGNDQALKVTLDRQRQPVTKKPVASTSPKKGAFVRVQRPTLHPEPELVRVIGSGKDGVKVTNALGKAFNVRHTHIIERNPAITGQERTEFMRSLASRGVPIDRAEQFLTIDHEGNHPRRPTSTQLDFAETIQRDYGIPLDLDAIRQNATYDDLKELISMFVTDDQADE